MSHKKNGVLILIRDNEVQIYEGGICMNSELKDWIGTSEVDILDEYLQAKGSKKEGGEG